MYILIGADLVPTNSNEEYFKKAEIEKLLDRNVLKIFTEADYRICNLETPLYDGYSPIKKNGPNMSSSTDTINGIKALNIDLLTLANNHIMDHGIQGLNSTIKALDNYDIKYLGVGSNKTDAQKPYIFKFADKRIGVYACTEHEFSVATDCLPGANPLDLLEITDHISQLRKRCDYLIVLYHGGKEYYRFPSPMLQKICRKLADKGANLIITQHSHCVGCKEEYKDSTIIYGQGNFLFDKEHNEFWDEGLLIAVNEDFKIDYIPLRKCELSKFYDRSRAIEDPEFVKEEYSRFAKKMYEKQTSPFRKKETLPFRIINKLLCNKARYKTVFDLPEDKLLARINYIECEAHRELLIEGLRGHALQNSDNFDKL